MLLRVFAILLIACSAIASPYAGPSQHGGSAATAPATSRPAASTAPSQSQPATEDIVIAGEKFRLEIAANEPAREKGLMGRDHIDPNGGMLFIYPQPKELSFWMANCIIDIDILFLDAKGRIVATHKMKAEAPRKSGESQDEYEARLKRYESKRLAQFAIELKAGTIDRLKLKPGQMIEMDVQRLGHMGR